MNRIDIRLFNEFGEFIDLDDNSFVELILHFKRIV